MSRVGDVPPRVTPSLYPPDGRPTVEMERRDRKGGAVVFADDIKLTDLMGVGVECRLFRSMCFGCAAARIGCRRCTRRSGLRPGARALELVQGL